MRNAVIVGAGVFGASLAWWLARSGWDVTLVDQFDPGDARATSGGETRLIRCGHGEDALYPASAWRARELWHELEAESGSELLVECGLAWFAHREDGWEGASARVLGEAGIPWERLEPGEAARLSPSLRTDDLAFVLLEPHAGVLRAQRAVQALAAAAVQHGARLVRGRARPDGARAVLEDGTVLEADRVVWSCGGWLSGLFGDVVELRVTRQELFFLDGGPEWRRGARGVGLRRAAAGHRSGERAAGARDGRVALPGARRRAAEGLEDLPLRALGGRPLRRRRASGAARRVARRRRLRSRLQARAGARRADRGGGGGGAG